MVVRGENFTILALAYKQGGNQDKNGSNVQVSFPISFSQNCLSVVTELTHRCWDPGETNVWDVSATGFSVGEQDSGGFWGVVLDSGRHINRVDLALGI